MDAVIARRKARFERLPEGPARLLAFPKLWSLPESTGYVLWLDENWNIVATAHVEFVIPGPRVTSSPGPFFTTRYHWFDTKLRRSNTKEYRYRVCGGASINLYLYGYYGP